MSGFLPHLIRTLTERVDGIQAILLHGSQQNPQVADMWSDYDVCIVLNSSARIYESQFILAVNDIGTVVGREVYLRSHSVLYRTAIEFQSSICLLDATVSEFHEWNSTENRDQPTILFGHIELSSTPNTPVTHAAFRPDETAIDPTWFKYIGAIKKFCRHDNLIGMHLLLDLIREYLVLEMVERDQRKRTNIHRYGDHERLPGPIQLSQIDESDTTRVLDYIAQLAVAYDQKLVSMVEGYTSRVQSVLRYIERSKAHLLG